LHLLVCLSSCSVLTDHSSFPRFRQCWHLADGLQARDCCWREGCERFPWLVCFRIRQIYLRLTTLSVKALTLQIVTLLRRSRCLAWPPRQTTLLEKKRKRKINELDRPFGCCSLRCFISFRIDRSPSSHCCSLVLYVGI